MGMSRLKKGGRNMAREKEGRGRDINRPERAPRGGGGGRVEKDAGRKRRRQELWRDDITWSKTWEGREGQKHL